MKRSKLRLLDLESLRQIKILSNTPAYLYKHFKNNNSVQRLASSSSVDDLKSILEYLKNRKRKSNDYEVKVYAVAVALGFKEYGEVRNLLVMLDSFNIKWMRELKRMLSTSFRPTTTHMLELSFRVTNPVHFESDSSNTIVSKRIEPTMSEHP